MTNAKQERLWGKPTEQCRLSLSADGPSVPAGKPVALELVFRNDGPTPIQFPRVSIWFEYDYTVTVADGGPVGLTSFGEEKRRSMEEQGGTLLEFQPKSETTASVEISCLYDLTRPGDYTIEAAKTLPNRKGDGFIKVVSNKVSLRRLP